MILPASQEHRRSLASIEIGERVRVRTILFSLLREDCGRMGLSEGDEVVCKRGSSTMLVLVSEDGRTIVLDRDRARFIEVTAVALDPSSRASGLVQDVARGSRTTAPTDF